MTTTLSHSNSLRIFTAILLTTLLTACGGGGGGSDSDNSPTPPADIFNADNYINTDLDDSNLSGTWMLVEASTLEFDLSDFSSQQGFFTLDYSRRATINIFDLSASELQPINNPQLPSFPPSLTESNPLLGELLNPPSNLPDFNSSPGIIFNGPVLFEIPDIILNHCMDNSLASSDFGNIIGGTISLVIEGFVFEGSIINNNLIEGSLSGPNQEGNATIRNSQVTLVKIDDFASRVFIPSMTPSTIDLSVNEDNLQDLFPQCFEETDFSGESFIDDELVDISGKNLYLFGIYDANNDGIINISNEAAGISIVEVLANDINSQSLEINTPSAMFLDGENVSININTSSLTSISGTANGTDNLGQQANVDFTFNINPEFD